MPKQAKKSPKDIVKTGREVAQVVEESKGQKFCKLEKLGEGAFGTAYRVQKTDNSDGKTYVLKEIRCRDKEQVIDALREMVTMRILQCPWVVRYEDYWTEGLNVILVMEYCPGGDLYKEMNAALKARTKIPEARVMRWFAQIALGLNEIHNRSFMHRDIKPSNILLDAGGNAKLGDFGLTNNVGGASIDESYRGTICGTPGFLSPELERSDKYNVKSDVWALGCTLYEILALRSVFQDTVEGVFPAPIPDSYSQEVRDLLKFLLTEDMHRRPHIEDVLKVKIVHQYVRELLGSPPSQVEEALPVQCTDNAFDVGALIRKVKQGNINSAINDLRANPVITSIFALLVFMMLKILRIL